MSRIHHKENTSSHGANRNMLKLIIILLIIFIMGAVITATIYINYKVLDSFVVNASVKVVDYRVAGLNADPGELIFGKTYPGGGGTRYFSVMSSQEALVHIRTIGPLADHISFSNNSFIIYPGQNISITADLTVPRDMIPGNYTSKVHVYFLRP